MAREGTIVVEVLAAASTGAKSIDEINRPLGTSASTTDRVAHESIVSDAILSFAIAKR